ncbi:MAG: acyl-CoA dehydrogenase family protein [Halieaceae bacterium]|nr:acyl-CoA dehydrogenase family protein [Halieaceae bacterium]MCP5164779.1 acyl-CoA dehydrogenase family protein [Pseudomonadales bacterium]
MNFDFTEEQVMLRDSVARFVQDDYDFDTRRRIAGSDEAMSRDNWRIFAELGWLSIPFAEEHGGFGGNAVDTMVVMEQLGKGLVLEPYFATVVLFGGLLQRGGSAAQLEHYLPQIIGGECLGAFAYLERQSRYELADVKTTATRMEGGYRLDGEKVVVFNGASADQLIVSARTSGAQSDEGGISLFLVPADAPGVERLDYRLMDGQRVANIVFSGVELAADALVGELDKGYELMQALVLEANVALAAEAVGIMELLNAKTVEYTKTRKQFGVAIGSFQALQHRMVDTFMAYEQTKSLLYRAVCAMTDDNEDAVTAIHALKVMVDRAGKLVFGEAIQMHGGMGLTDELDIGHYAKRLMMINTTFGNGDYHQEKFNALRYQQ